MLCVIHRSVSIWLGLVSHTRWKTIIEFDVFNCCKNIKEIFGVHVSVEYYYNIISVWTLWCQSKYFTENCLYVTVRLGTLALTIFLLICACFRERTTRSMILFCSRSLRGQSTDQTTQKHVEESQLGNCAQKGKGKGGPNWHADWTMMQVTVNLSLWSWHELF